MLTDAHCHPFNLKEYFPDAETERGNLGVMGASSATTPEEFVYCEQIALQAKAAGAPPLLPCYAVHPQYPANKKEPIQNTLETLAAEGRLAAVGETGFDLYNAAFRETEKIQDDLFAGHLETALRYDLPLVIHARRAMHKIFFHAAMLKKCRAVVFHSWPGTAGEGEALLRKGINAFFSFGTVIMLNHREAIRCCSVFPADCLLTETDAPFQPPRGREFSRYADLTDILNTMASLRREAGTEGTGTGELENIIEKNFRSVFVNR